MSGVKSTINPTGAIFGPTLGISRNMEANIDAQGLAVPLEVGPSTQGGGDLNGTASTSILHYQSGTNATRWQQPRKFCNPGNWCGIV
jgi:hypothetical protein